MLYQLIQQTVYVSQFIIFFGHSLISLLYGTFYLAFNSLVLTAYVGDTALHFIDGFVNILKRTRTELIDVDSAVVHFGN